MSSGVGFNSTALATVVPPAAVQSHSPWSSPVPYVFGGLVVVLGLISFAFLLLACSEWNLSRYLDGSRNAVDVESGSNDGKQNAEAVMEATDFVEGIVVIMAGDEKPTFLATPFTSRASSFKKQRSNRCCSSSSANGSNKTDSIDDEKKMDQEFDDSDSASILIEI